jgi:hypothetical protein
MALVKQQEAAMVVWRGWGLLTVGIAAAALAVAELTAGAADPAGLRARLGAVLLVGAAANLWLGRRLNTRPARVMIDTRAARRVLVRPRNDLLFVPMEYWSAAFVLGAAALASA